jgi:hypothetical protein
MMTYSKNSFIQHNWEINFLQRFFLNLFKSCMYDTWHDFPATKILIEEQEQRRKNQIPTTHHLYLVSIIRMDCNIGSF